METLQEKCLRLIEEGKYVIRRKAGLFTEEEISQINTITKWIKNDDFKERVFCIAYNIDETYKCPITGNLIKSINKTYYNRLGKLRVLNFIFPQTKLESKIKKLYYKYDETIIETEFRKMKANVSKRYPIFINHCWVQLEKRGFDLNIIESNEEAFHLYRENYKEIPICDIAKIKRKFNIKSICYQVYSSTEASHIASSIKHTGKIVTEETIEKRKNTCIEKYGVSSPFKLDVNKKKAFDKRLELNEIKRIENDRIKALDTRTKLEKYTDTCMEKYGVENPSKIMDHFKEIHGDWTERSIQTRKENSLKKYGVENPMQLKEISQKSKDTCLEKYGVTCCMNLPEIREKSKLDAKIKAYDNFKRFKHLCIPEFTIEEWIEDTNKKFPWRKTCNNEIFNAYYTGYPPIGRFKNSTLEQYVGIMLDKMNITYNKNCRDVIKSRELDIYIPELKIAIECNGEYWHSTKYNTDKNYHLEKKQLCKEQGISLLHFWGKSIMITPKIVNGIIRNKIKGNKYKIFGRKCKIKSITPEVARKFSEKYHLNGFSAALNHIGMFYKNRLVSYISIGENRFTNKNSNAKELIRYVTMNNFYIIGGIEKFISYVKNILKVTELITYSDNNLFEGSCYKRAGFIYEGITKPGYFYNGGSNMQYSRYQCQKHKLSKLLGDKFDPNKTEEENMNNSKFYRVYDCGHHKFRLNFY